MKTLLIPVDFSDTSKKALKVAAIIAKRVNAKIVLTHMAGIESGLTKEPNNFEEALYYSKLIGKKFEEFTQVSFLDGVIVEPVLQKHLSFASVSEMAIELDVNLIVMGSHGSQGLEEFFMGSNTEKVVRSSEIPVLVIKDNDLNFAPETVLYASDFKLETVSAYNRIVEINKMLGTRLEFLYVNTPANNFKTTYEMDDVLLDFFKEVKHSNPVEAIKTVKRFSDYTVEQGIMRYAALVGADIIAIPTHGRKGLAHFLQGSISEDVANHAKMPVLTVKM
ncbi:MAG: universal stress protein [Winogradskyella sp.]|uniref:universal stress protein n=1 Tax=Winogradskyella sp. TaxID=1883156 RepID=UPI000F3F5798|nr:universal stress protein [Winogradskyella sp.]RNC87232.1 MAG: universal stress protein [Winogradskyella sp.]